MRQRSRFHGSYRWKKARRIAKIAAGFKCARCGTVAPEPGGLHVHHRKAVADHPAVRLEPLNYRVLCPACHNIEEPRTGTPRPSPGCDSDGMPLSPDHPWNRP